MYNTLNLWVLDFEPIIRYSTKLENMTFRKLDLFSSSREGREIPTLLGPSERASLNHWTSRHQKT
jgi:hypothetical protein